MTFGECLITQKNGGAIANLIAAVRAETAFLCRRSLDDIRKLLNEMQANGDAHAAVNDAETYRLKRLRMPRTAGTWSDLARIINREPKLVVAIIV